MPYFIQFLIFIDSLSHTSLSVVVLGLIDNNRHFVLLFCKVKSYKRENYLIECETKKFF